MMVRKRKVSFKFIWVAVVVSLLCGFGMTSYAERTPRILLSGDSWTGFLLAFRSYKVVLEERTGLERWIEVGNRTAEMGARAWEMLERGDPYLNYLDVLTEELTNYQEDTINGICTANRPRSLGKP